MTAGEGSSRFGIFAKLFYMPSPYSISGTPPALPFKSHPYLPEPKIPGAKGSNVYAAAPSPPRPSGGDLAVQLAGRGPGGEGAGEGVGSRGQFDFFGGVLMYRW
eukprot:CAMPEP_0173413540 /NCGR_PEP_ID=MMETSP1356-20130122/82297_1 /TAXON_ID=77927 ORGANISM="Hemiselmis virescens, Strain PCC157" /NCGR_SAMPLE_ID=MMETSP1356 /ASSEMBLY_ACC=CAM_ASM_000847 /LENGTH=103 /DNA_ID=CAMNT_0014375595 /DNA_START=211 /DNA_END=520 /DNA_ORIENTATION=+